MNLPASTRNEKRSGGASPPAAESPPLGVLLVNLGSPDAPEPAALKRYLAEFLGDPRVLELHPLATWLLLRLVVLPRRPRAL